ncbi:MAG: phosphoribosyl-ATP diphosphatase [Spirochaetales bacterium]|uniref:Phosphoribosyl-ATP pyrophosphatase n=1 Tax=Candidatus Thalassospirochaeta sargassi TaxID=3119039 RepID=A0AAJ1MLV7_9SPIO|nr:phosphoribosyl-ATP diphosphatase [Spirochaetales bacterium]
MNSKILPYAVVSPDGRILSMLQTNEKGYKKSIENSQIWAVNPETERLLPVEIPGTVCGFSEKEGWYEVVVGDTAKSAQETEGASDRVSAKAPGAVSTDSDAGIIDRLYSVIEKRKIEMPEGSYTTHLFNSGLSKIKKKTGEEAVELLLAENHDEIVYEAADLIYHMLVLLAAADIRPEEIFKELESRE